MKVNLRVSTAGDRQLILSLLEAGGLPAESLDSGTTTFFVAETRGEPVGVAGFEFYDGDALLRSVAVRPDTRNKGCGSGIVDLMLDEARKRKTKRVILLTETARDFFRKRGFEVTERSTLDNARLKASSEFEYACPKSAACMKLELERNA